MGHPVCLVIPADDDCALAVQAAVRRCSSVQQLRYQQGVPFLDSEEPFELTPDILCALQHRSSSSSTGAAAPALHLSTKTKSVQDLLAYVQEAVRRHRLDLHNKLGGSLYVFDQIHVATMQELNLPPLPQLHFEKHRFTTGKSFDNVFFQQKDLVQSRVRFFLDRRDWYEAKGVAHTLGILLTGPPGVGKTSLIKAIARETGRHIVSVNMKGVETRQQFAALFHSGELQCQGDGSSSSSTRAETLEIPVDSRILVLEDLDAAGNNVTLRRDFHAEACSSSGDEDEEDEETAPLLTPFLSRGAALAAMHHYGNGAPAAAAVYQQQQQPRRQQQQQHMLHGKQDKQQQQRCTLTLSDILNVMDGVVETPGRITIFTSNHPERIDPALLRPGRCDLQVQLTLATRTAVAQLYECYFEQSLAPAVVQQLPHLKYSPAFISALLLGSFSDHEAAVQQLLHL